MPLTKPARLDPKWWKAHYPKSMPTNKAIEELIRDFDEKPPTKVGPALNKFAKQAKGGLDIDAISPRYADLIAEIKRTKAMLTKAKHEDLAKMMDELVKMVDTEKQAMEKLLKAAQKKGAEEHDSGAADIPVKWDEAVKDFDAKYLAKLKRCKALMDRAEKDSKQAAEDKTGDKKERAETLVRHAGINRSLPSLVEKLRQDLEAKVKKADKAAAAAAADAKAKSFATAGKAAIKQIAELTTACEALDKRLVGFFIQAFGDAAGKKLFTAVKPVAMKL